MKKLQIMLLIFLLLPVPVLADMLVPFSYGSAMFLPAVIIIEAFVFWLLSKKIKMKIGIKKIVLVVLIANIVSSLIGVIFSYDLYKITNLALSRPDNIKLNLETEYGIFIYLILTVIIELPLFYIFLRKEYKLKDLITICIILNVVSYAFLTLYFVYRPRSTSTINDMYAARNAACTSFVREYGCNASTNEVVTENFDSNMDGKKDSSDTLFELCKNYYGIKTDIECKQMVCSCGYLDLNDSD